MSYDRTNTGTIAKNSRKTEDKHPDIAGQINVEGREYWLNGWLKKNNSDGSTFYSLSVKPKEQRQASSSYSADKSQRHPAPSFGGSAGPDDDIPFAPEWR